MFGDLIGDIDWSDGVLPDVSNSEPSMQPTTPTGTGTGYYVDPGYSTGLFNTLSSALNYAIYRDQQKIAQNTGTVLAMPATASSAAAVAQAQNSRFMLLLLIGGGLLLATRGK